MLFEVLLSEQNQSVLFYSTHACLYLSLTVFLKWDSLIKLAWSLNTTCSASRLQELLNHQKAVKILTFYLFQFQSFLAYAFFSV